MNGEEVDGELEPCTVHPHDYKPLTAVHFLIHWCALLKDPSPANPMRGELLKTVSDACEQFSRRYWTDPYIPYLLCGLIVLQKGLDSGLLTINENADKPIWPIFSAQEVR